MCGTHHPGPLVAGCLAPLLGAVDQIVVGADERVGEEDLAWYGTVADRLVTFPFTGSNQYRGWLREQCDTDWILVLDGDEMPSQALVEQLGDLAADRDVAGYRVRLAWLFPDGRHRLASPPWSGDFQSRFARNDDRLWFPSRKHDNVRVAGSCRTVDLALLHLDLVWRSVADRRAKVALYESQLRGHVTGAQSTNEAFYLPEDREDLDLVPISTIDAARVEAVLRPARRTSPPGSPRVTVRATVADIQRHVPWARFSDDDATAALKVIDIPSRPLVGGAFDRIGVQVHNLGRRPWPAGSEREPLVRLAYHWELDGVTVVFDGRRTLLPHLVRGGTTADLDVLVEAPTEAGTYDLVLDVVADGDRWFGVDQRVQLDVGPSPAQQLRAGGDGLVPIDDVFAVRDDLARPGELARLMSTEPAVPDEVAAVARRLFGVRTAPLHLTDRTEAALGAGGDDVDLVTVSGPSPAVDAWLVANVDEIRRRITRPTPLLIGNGWNDVRLALASSLRRDGVVDLDGLDPGGRGVIVGRLLPP